MGAGILGIGVATGQETRPNAWWSDAITSRWREASAKAESFVETAHAAATGHEKKTLEFFLSDVADPFRGARERPIMGEGETVDDLVTRAATSALEAAGVSARDVDLLVAHDFCPSLVMTNPAATVHHRLGMRPEALAFSIEAASNSFLTQLQLATNAVRSGSVERVLLTQSNTVSPVMPWDEDYSALFGDVASAVIIGKVPEGRGIVSFAHDTAGELQGHLKGGAPGHDWWDAARVHFYSDDAKLRFEVFRTLGAMFNKVGTRALEYAKADASKIEIVAAHQGFAWLPELTKHVTGTLQAEVFPTYPTMGNIGSASVPVQLQRASAAGRLQAGTQVLIVTGGAGVTTSASFIKW